MSKILVLVDKYLPNPSSNGVVASNIVDCLLSSGHEVTIATIFPSEGLNVYSINKTVLKTCFINKVFGYCQDGYAVNEIYKLALRLHEEKQFDAIICFYMSAETLFCGYKLQKKIHCKLFAFFLDIPGITFEVSWKKRVLFHNYKRLYKAIEKKGYIVSLKYYEKYFIESANIDNVFFVGIPNLIKNPTSTQSKNDSKIDLVYAGSFYDKIRNPSEMLEAMKFIIGTDIYLHLFSWGCESVIDKYKELYRDNLVIHGRVSSQEARSAIANANVLLNLSNNVSYQVPGKIIEYFSTGKPIINFIYSSNDSAIADYEKYPLIFNCDLCNGIDQKKLLCFIHKEKNNTVPFEMVQKLYADSNPLMFVNYFDRKMK